jgi:pimeloyl-ACP methyl ester carboxylesterase
MTNVTPFRIAIPDGVLEDLRARLRNTRWPPRAPGDRWQLGTDVDFLQGLVDYWATDFDWRAVEAELNRRGQFTADIEGSRIHVVHQRARDGKGIPLILTHGWPSGFIEYLPVADLLVDPPGVGGLAPAFDVVVPSLPGYGFSQRPAQIGVNYRHVARIWHSLMNELGYERYAVGGGDFGAGVASLIALDHPEAVIGVHLTNFELLPDRAQIAGAISPGEQAFFDASDKWWQREKGYKQIQSTRPQTLSYGLADSPIGLAAWILEKWRSWTDCGGDVEQKFGRDFLLELVTLYWLNGSIATSILDYYDNRWRPSLPDARHRIERPTAFAVFGHGFAGEPEPPRSLVERLYNVTRWTEMPRGGHFAPVEEPQLVAADISAFFSGLI